MPRRSEKIGRNELCPCGSKRKFKVCHGGIRNLPTPEPGQIDSRLRSITQSAVCLSPSSLHCDCQGKVIASHTLSRSGSLREITRDNHIYSYELGIQRIHALKGSIEPKLVGWKDASTFPGFCAHHDKHLFSPLEDKPFIGDQHQCFLLAYRSITWEWYAKQKSDHQRQYRSALTVAKRPELRAVMAHFNHMNELGLKDITEHKNKYDEVMTYNRWTDCHGLLIEFDGIFPIQCSAAWSPTEDIQGKQIQILNSSPRTPQMTTIGSFAANRKSYFILSWLNDSAEVSLKLVSSIHAAPRRELPSIIGALLLMTSENCHISPVWYESLNLQEKNQVNGLMHPFSLTKPSPQIAASKLHINGVHVVSLRTF